MTSVPTHAKHVVEVFVADVDGAAVHELHHGRQVLMLHVLQVDDWVLARVDRQQLLPAAEEAVRALVQGAHSILRIIRVTT